MRALSGWLVLVLAACTGDTPPFVPRGNDRSQDADGGDASDADRKNVARYDAGRTRDTDAAPDDLRDGSRDVPPERDGNVDPDTDAALSDAATSDAATQDAALPGQLIGADEGGEVTDGSGRVVLRIPAGALPRDLVVRIVPSAGVPWGGIPDIGFTILPEGLRFEPPAELRIEVASIETPGPWLAPVLRSTPDGDPPWRGRMEGPRDGDWLSAQIAYADSFGLEWEAIGLPQRCPVRPSNFAPCGGELEGEWTLEGSCHDTPWGIFYERPSDRFPEPECDVMYTGELPEGSMIATTFQGIDEWPLSGSLAIADGRFVRSAVDAVIPLIPAFVPQCIGDDATCDDVSTVFFGRVGMCPGTSWCECRCDAPRHIDPIDAALTRAGNTFYLDAGPVLDYCVEDGRLHVLETGPLGPQITVYRR